MSLKEVREYNLIEHLRTIRASTRVALIYDKPHEINALRNSPAAQAPPTQKPPTDASKGGIRRIKLSLNQAGGRITIEAYNRYELAAAEEGFFVEALSGYDHIILSNPDMASSLDEAIEESLSSFFGAAGARMLLLKIRDPHARDSSFDVDLFRRNMQPLVGAAVEQLEYAFLRGLRSRLRSDHRMKGDDAKP
jgi:hypothetical protein